MPSRLAIDHRGASRFAIDHRDASRFAIPALQAGLDDADLRFAATCLRGLGAALARLPDEHPHVAALLRRCLEGLLQRDDHLRGAALEVLGSRLLAGLTARPPHQSLPPGDRAVLKALLVGLADSDPAIARDSAAHLGRMLALLGDSAAGRLLRQALCTGLRGTAWELRPACAHMLGPFADDPEVADALRLALTDPAFPVRRAAAEALQQGGVLRRRPRGPGAAALGEALIVALKDPQPQVRVAAVRALATALATAPGNAPDPATGEPRDEDGHGEGLLEERIQAALLAGLRDDIYGRMRLSCAEALAPLCEAPVVAAALGEALRDSYWPLRELCANLLHLPEEARAVIDPAGTSGGHSGPHVVAKGAPAELSPRRVPPAQLAVAELRGGLRHPDPDVRLASAHWLGTRGDDRDARRALIDALLGGAGGDEDTPADALDELLPSWMVSPASVGGRAACALALGSAVEEITVRRALLDGLCDAHGEVREACARALRSASSIHEVREALLDAWRRGDSALRLACCVALRPVVAHPAVASALLDGLQHGEGPEEGDGPGAAAEALRCACAGALGDALVDPMALAQEGVALALLAGLGDPAPGLRAACADALAGSLPTLQRQEDALLSGLRGEDALRRDGCARAVVGLLRPATPALVKALLLAFTTAEEGAGRAALPTAAGARSGGWRTAATSRDPRLAPRSVLPSPEPAAQVPAALRALHQALGDPHLPPPLQRQVVSALVAGLRGAKDAGRRAACAAALQPIASGPAPQGSVQAALREGLADPSPVVQHACVLALGGPSNDGAGRELRDFLLGQLAQGGLAGEHRAQAARALAPCVSDAVVRGALLHHLGPRHEAPLRCACAASLAGLTSDAGNDDR